MARFIGKLFLLIPILLLIIIVELLFRQIPNDFSYKNKWLSQHASELKILAIGGSHGYFGINPCYFSQSAFNAGYVSQSLNWDLVIIDKFIPKCDSLQFLIIPISAPSLFYSLENTEESWRVKNYHIYYGGNYYAHFYERFDPSNHFAIYNMNLITAIQPIVSFYKNGYYKLNCNDLGFGTGYSHDKKAKDWEKSGAIAAKRHTVSSYQKDYDENMAYLNAIIARCKNQKIKVILLTTPTWHTYFENLDKKQLDLTIRTCKKLAEQNSDVSYLNMLYDNRFKSDDFFDADHLNEIGAKKLTLILNDTLPKLR